MTRNVQVKVKPPPSPLWYALPLAIVIATIGVIGYFLPKFNKFMPATNELTRIVVPGSKVLNLTKPGHYTIFHESNIAADGAVPLASYVWGLSVALVSLETGRHVVLRVPNSQSSYTINNRSGYSIYQFNIHTPGQYELAALYKDNLTTPVLTLAVAHEFLNSILKFILAVSGLTGFAIAGMLSAGALTTKIHDRRNAAKLSNTSSSR